MVKLRRRPVHHEHYEQVKLFAWAKYMERAHPELKLLFAVPNGGLRHPATAARLRREGVRAGVPDVLLPVARHGWHGLFIELKVRPNKPTALQQQWIEALRQEGYRVEVCYGFEEAKSVVVEYLAL